MLKRFICTNIQLNYLGTEWDLFEIIKLIEKRQGDNSINIFSDVGTQTKKGRTLNEWIFNDLWSRVEID